jgi:hypothetical protein
MVLSTVRAPCVIGIGRSSPLDVVDVHVRLRGTCGGFYNGRNQFIALEVLVPSFADIAVLERPTTTYSEMQVESIRSILRSVPNPNHPVHLNQTLASGISVITALRKEFQ